MSELGDLLELMHGASRRWNTARLVTREWSQAEGRHIAFDRQRRAAGGSNAGSVSTASALMTAAGAEEPATSESVSRLWIDRLGERTRTERDGEYGGSLHIRVEDLWWSYNPDMGATSNQHDPPQRRSSPTLEATLDPSILIPQFDFTEVSAVGAATVAGRPAVTALATTRMTNLPPALLGHPAPGADDLVIAIDAERGVILRFEARVDDRTFSTYEVVEADFDEDFSPELFTFVPPNGGPVRSSLESWPRVEPVSVEEAVRQAPFTVLVPTRLPEGWTLTAGWYPGARRPFHPTSVIIHVLSEDVQDRLHIYQSSTSSSIHLSGSRQSSDDENWELVERDGRRIDLHRHRTSPEPIYDAAIEMAGTLVRASGILGRESTLDIVGSLAPAPASAAPSGVEA
jgi:outer membrane lipoprotein-sorting protein